MLTSSKRDYVIVKVLIVPNMDDKSSQIDTFWSKMVNWSIKQSFGKCNNISWLALEMEAKFVTGRDESPVDFYISIFVREGEGGNDLDWE